MILFSWGQTTAGVLGDDYEAVIFFFKKSAPLPVL